MIDKIEKSRFDDLRFEQGRAYRQNGFVREHDLPFAHRLDRTREFEIFQVFQKTLGEKAKRGEIGDIFLVEAQIFKILRRLLHARRDRIRDQLVRAEKEIERRLAFMDPFIEIPLSHR